jgi:hypothetical protein
MSRDNPDDELKPVAAFLPGLDLGPGLKLPKKPAGAGKRPRAIITPIERRLIEAAAADQDEQSILYQHTVFCQTGMPYRDPGEDVRVWDRSNGHAALRIEAGAYMSSVTGGFVDAGLPFGPKPRLILAHLNTEALLTGKAEIETERTLTRFVSHGLKMDTKGRNMRMVKEQLTRLSACTIRLGMVKDGQGITVKSDIISSFSVWLEKDERQRVLWPSLIQLDPKYFESLQRHAVPLDENHLAALSHSAMALDVYSWLAQRLHRIEQHRTAFVPWVSVSQQFGLEYDRIRKFREVFKVALGQVQAVYREARVKPGPGGLTLWRSPPPVKRKLFPTFMGKPHEPHK